MRFLGAVAACLLFIAPASAQSVHQARGVWCDTPDQTRQFLSLWDGSNSAVAVAAVNETAGKKNACMALQVAVMEVEAYEAVTTETGTWRVIRVQIVALGTPSGWVQVTPFDQFTARKDETMPGEGA